MRFTSYLPGVLYTPAECIEKVEYFTQKIFKKINSEYGPDIHNERLEILEFLYLVEKSWQIFSKKSLITTPKVKAVEARAVKKKIHKILSEKTIFLHIFILKPNKEEQETQQFDMDMAVAEEYIECYADKYKKLIRKHKFAMPLSKHTDKNKLYNAIATTYNIQTGYYITAECIKDVEKFAQKLHGKFGHKDGPFYANEVVIEIFLHDLEHFLTDIYHTDFFFE